MKVKSKIELVRLQEKLENQLKNFQGDKKEKNRIRNDLSNVKKQLEQINSEDLKMDI